MSRWPLQYTRFPRPIAAIVFFSLLSPLLSNVPLSIHSMHRGRGMPHVIYTLDIENTIIPFYIFRMLYGVHAHDVYTLYTIIYNARPLCIFIIYLYMYIGTPTSRSTLRIMRIVNHTYIHQKNKNRMKWIEPPPPPFLSVILINEKIKSNPPSYSYNTNNNLIIMIMVYDFKSNYFTYQILKYCILLYLRASAISRIQII